MKKLDFSDVKESLQNQPFKTVFKATMAFYAAQFAATVLGLLVLGLGVGAAILIAM